MNRDARTAYGCILAFTGYAAAAPAMAWTFASTGKACAYGRFLTDCDFGTRGYDPKAYLALALVTVATMLAVRLKAHSRAWYPVAMLFCGLTLFTTGYDSIVRRPVIGIDKIVDDTFNTLRFAIMASFLLVFAISRRVRLSPMGTILAIAASNVAAILVAVLFRELSAHVMGTTMLLLLFLLYAFGGFGVHIMATSWLFASGTMDDDARYDTLGRSA